MHSPFALKWLWLLAAWPQWAMAQPLAQRIEDVVRQHWLAHAEAQHWRDPVVDVAVIGNVSGLKCPAPPELSVADARHATRMSIRVACPGPSGWQHELVARAQLSAKVLVAAQAVSAGFVLGEDKVELAMRDVTATPDALGRPDAVAGQASRRSLRTGQVVQQRFLTEAILVRRGSAVRIVVSLGAVSAETAGEGLENGALGRIVRVRNAATGKIISARVTGTGTVEPAE